MLTRIPKLERPAGDEVLDQNSVTLHEDLARDQVDGGPLQICYLQVHRAQLCKM